MTIIRFETRVSIQTKNNDLMTTSTYIEKHSTLRRVTCDGHVTNQPMVKNTSPSCD